jgi:hypothetical protein
MCETFHEDPEGSFVSNCEVRISKEVVRLFYHYGNSDFENYVTLTEAQVDAINRLHDRLLRSGNPIPETDWLKRWRKGLEIDEDIKGPEWILRLINDFELDPKDECVFSQVNVPAQFVPNCNPSRPEDPWGQEDELGQ